VANGPKDELPPSSGQYLPQLTEEVKKQGSMSLRAGPLSKDHAVSLGTIMDLQFLCDFIERLHMFFFLWLLKEIFQSVSLKAGDGLFSR
jgi:hypothetical protein